MKFFTALVFILLSTFWCSVTTASELIVVDDNGAEVRLAQPAKRIISLAPNITEVLFHIGAGEQIVGADEYSNYPPRPKKFSG